MDTKPRLTKQGITDLNHYGPKPSRAVALKWRARSAMYR